MRAGTVARNPVPIHEVQPKYTGEAMRSKIQGEVHLEAIVLPDGTIGDIRVIRSLDRLCGLDQEAINAARAWRFMPGKDVTGQPVPVIVTLIMEFRLH